MSNNDEITASSSSAGYFESPHEAKRRALQEKLKKEGKRQAAKKEGANLQDLKLALLKDQVTENTSKVRPDDEEASSSLGTKTNEEQIKAETLDAQNKQDIDTVVGQSNAQQDIEEKQMKQEIQSDQS
jgi:hypothetical protein